MQENLQDLPRSLRAIAVISGKNCFSGVRHHIKIAEQAGGQGVYLHGLQSGGVESHDPGIVVGGITARAERHIQPAIVDRKPWPLHLQQPHSPSTLF